MNDIDIRFYLSLLLRRLPYILAISITATLAGIVLAYTPPPLYRADDNLAEDPQIPTEMARSTVPTTAFAQFQIIGQEVTTQDYLTQLAARLNVYADSETPMSSAEIATDMRSRIRLEQVELDGASAGSGATVFASPSTRESHSWQPTSSTTSLHTSSARTGDCVRTELVTRCSSLKRRLRDWDRN